MKLYVMKPVLTQVPIIWTARIRRDLVPARRRTPAWRMEIKARRQRWKEIENDPRIKMLGKMIEEITKRWPQEAPTDGREGKPVEFRRFVRIPPMAATLIEIEERNNHGTDDADAQEPD